jgi:DMSO/TMAO reductase YedYZ molybdopterin-dependent catalytic subunit
MAGRRTNLALLALLPLAVLTGALTFLVGSGPVRLVVVAHGAVGMALIVLVPWKSTIARRGVRRARPGRWTSLVLAFAVIVALVTGLAHSTGLLLGAFGISALQVHVGAALVALVPAVLHVRRRRIRPRTTDLSRRSLTRAGLLALAAGALYAGAAGAGSLLQLPGARRRATGSYETGSGNPSAMPTTSWLLDRVPDAAADPWRLTVRSAGATASWSLADLATHRDEVTAVIDCTGGWWAQQTWVGVRVSRLLADGATGSVLVTSATGYSRRLPLTDDLLLALAVGGAPLSPGHGAPARLVVPGRRGFHWVKWVVEIEHDQHPWWWESPVPLQ